MISKEETKVIPAEETVEEAPKLEIESEVTEDSSRAEVKKVKEEDV